MKIRHALFVFILCVCMLLPAAAFAEEAPPDTARFEALVAANATQEQLARHSSVQTEGNLCYQDEVIESLLTYTDADKVIRVQQNGYGLYADHERFMEHLRIPDSVLYVDLYDDPEGYDVTLAGQQDILSLSVEGELLLSTEETDGTFVACTVQGNDDITRGYMENTFNTIGGYEYQEGMKLFYTYTFDAASSDLMRIESTLQDADGTEHLYGTTALSYDVEAYDPAAEGSPFAEYLNAGMRTVSVTFAADTDEAYTLVYTVPCRTILSPVRNSSYLDPEEVFADPACTQVFEDGDGMQDAALYIAKKPFAYEHDPRENPTAMRDIVVNPDAVYGFSPSAAEESTLKDYVDEIDWTDAEQVAAAREQRQAYHDSMEELYDMILDMTLADDDIETIARAVSQRRNELRLEAYTDDPEGLETVKKRNLETYGHEEGPAPDELFEKYGSWETVLLKALGTNAGMDACLGFYDDYYDLYGLEGELDDEAVF